jgi:hypothetical protein
MKFGMNTIPLAAYQFDDDDDGDHIDVLRLLSLRCGHH